MQRWADLFAATRAVVRPRRVIRDLDGWHAVIRHRRELLTAGGLLVCGSASFEVARHKARLLPKRPVSDTGAESAFRGKRIRLEGPAPEASRCRLTLLWLEWPRIGAAGVEPTLSTRIHMDAERWPRHADKPAEQPPGHHHPETVYRSNILLLPRPSFQHLHLRSSISEG